MIVSGGKVEVVLFWVGNDIDGGKGGVEIEGGNGDGVVGFK